MLQFRIYKVTKEEVKNNMVITDLKDMLEKSGKKYADKIAYQIKGKEGDYQKITHKEVRDRVNALGSALINMGLQGKKIALIGENRIEWEIAYLAIVCGTGIVVPLDKSLPENELKNLIQRSEVEAIFYSQKQGKKIKAIQNEEMGKVKHMISMDLAEHSKGIYSQQELIKEGRKLIQQGNRKFIEAKIDPQTMSIMLFTSGTTSEPKIVALSHHNICSNLMDIASALEEVDCTDVFLSFLPLHHVFECTVGFLFALYKGAKTVFCEGVRHIPENMKEYKVSVMASVPAIYERIFKNMMKQLEKEGKLQDVLQKQEQYRTDSMKKKKEIFQEIHNRLGGNVKLLISGAASLNTSIEEKYRLLGFNLVQGYGLTETSPVIAIGTNKHYKVGSVGKVLTNVKAKIINPNQEGIGELIVQGENVMLRYDQNKEETKKVLRDGWFYTGDLARIDEEGYLFICGRKKSVIVLKNGKNIFPEEMENLINQIEGIEESLVFGKPISKDKNNIKIFAKLVYNQKIVEKIYKVKVKEAIYQVIKEKIKELNKTMPTYKAIKGIILTQEPLLKTSTNKIKRREYRQLPELKTKYMGQNQLYYQEIDSTQLEIERRIQKKNIKNGTIVIADIQTKGRGTHGRKWHTDQKNNIAFSLYIETNCEIKKLKGITVMIAKTMVEVFKKIYGISLSIKKPNDIFYQDKKIGGILTQTKVGGSMVKYMIIGIRNQYEPRKICTRNCSNCHFNSKRI